MIEEIWKVIEEYPNYEVSNFGRVRNLKSNKLLKFDLYEQGYYRVQLFKNNKKKNKRVHRLVALSFIQQIPNKPDVNHKDGNKLNNHVDNLEWVTWEENNEHYRLLSLKL